MSLSNNKTLYIIGGGPSLQEIDFNKILTKDTLVINKTLTIFKNPTYYLTLDYTSTNKVGLPLLRQTQATKVFVANMTTLQNRMGLLFDPKSKTSYVNLLDIYNSIILARYEKGFGTTWSTFCCGNHSGHSALQYALLMNYSYIVLLGYDYDIKPNKTHFHNGYNQNITTFQTNLLKYYEDMKFGFQNFPLSYKDVHIISCSKQSKLNEFIEYRPFNNCINL